MPGEVIDAVLDLGKMAMIGLACGWAVLLALGLP